MADLEERRLRRAVNPGVPMFRVGVVGVGESRDEHRHAESGHQCGTELPAVMGVELDLRQQIGCGDTKEGARTEGQRRAQPGGVTMGPGTCAQMKCQRSQRRHQRESEDHLAPQRCGRPPNRHQGGNGQGSERLVENHRQGGSEPQHRAGPVLRGCGGGGQGQSIEDGVEGQAQGDADPAQVPGGAIRQRVGEAAGFRRGAFGNIMVVEREEPLDQEQGYEARQRPAHGLIGCGQRADGMRQETQHGQAEHEPGDESDGQLQPGMGEPDAGGQFATKPGRQERQQAVDGEQDTPRLQRMRAKP
ncbi:MAG: hypothetical protein KF833_07480 [Verrucomicrobiae bacterium]|nr:hypothetical protein [Verrucomicrobiae bacterium]